MAEKDDNPEILSNTQFFARTTDPDPYVFAAPEDGKYLIQVTSREANYLYGPKTTYRLRVGPPRPDFRVVAMAASKSAPEPTVLRADGNQYVEVYAFRFDGFTGPITLTAEGLPAGVTCSPQTIGAGPAGRVARPDRRPERGQVRRADHASRPPPRWPASRSSARPGRRASPGASSRGRTSRHSPGSIGGLVLCVRPNGYFKVTADPENAYLAKAGEKLPQPLTVKQGEKLTVPFKVARISPDAKVAITLRQVATTQNPAQMPVLVNNGQPLPAVAPDKSDGTFVIEAKTIAPPGTYTVVLSATAQIQSRGPGRQGEEAGPGRAGGHPGHDPRRPGVAGQGDGRPGRQPEGRRVRPTWWSRSSGSTSTPASIKVKFVLPDKTQGRHVPPR